jgi:NAD(P)-dependent dehydrogenase (short-subunit alcohol dehydrogenase family)
MPHGLQDRVVVITGALSGIGRATHYARMWSEAFVRSSAKMEVEVRRSAPHRLHDRWES